MKLPTLPYIIPGVKYPPYQLEEKLDAVLKTKPEEYLKTIKKLIKEIDDYRQCLEHQGYSVENLNSLDHEQIFVRKEVIIR